MFHRLKIRLKYFWNTVILRKKAVKADIFLIETYNRQTQKIILHKDWVEVASLWNKLLSWEGFVLANRPKVQYGFFQDIRAGWSKIYYE